MVEKAWEMLEKCLENAEKWNNSIDNNLYEVFVVFVALNLILKFIWFPLFPFILEILRIFE